MILSLFFFRLFYFGFGGWDGKAILICRGCFGGWDGKAILICRGCFGGLYILGRLGIHRY